MKRYEDHMISCPKCGSHSILGPTFRESKVIAGAGTSYEIEVRGSFMLWRCDRCGYQEHTESKDAKRAEREGGRDAKS